MDMNQHKKSKKTRLFHVIWLYFLCLLAAVCTWLAVMYAEQKAADTDAQAGKTGETVCLPWDEETLFL